MSQTPNELPPPPGQPSGEVPPPPPAPAQPAAPPTQVAGQQVAPTTAVPHVQGLAPQSTSTGGTNTLAIVSVVAAFGSFFAHIIPGIGGFTVALVAVVTGIMARRQIRQTGEQGMGLATLGIVVGLIHLALLVLAVLIIIVVIFVFGIAMFGFSRSSSG